MASLLKFYTRVPFALAAIFLVLTYSLSYEWSESLNFIGTLLGIGFAVLDAGVIFFLFILRLIHGKPIPDLRANLILLILQFPFVAGVFFVCASIRSGYS